MVERGDMAKIMIAEDEADIRDLISFTLTYAGYQVLSYPNGEELYAAVENEIPDLILLDVRMPVMNGYETCEKIKSNPVTKDIPVVFLSAKGQESEIQAGFDSGASEYLLKPFAPEELAQRVNELLNQPGITV
jgi:CheY-like chemotaxis protein